MTESRPCPSPNQLDIRQIIVEAQHRWLRPAEIREILSNHGSFCISPEPPHMPTSGSLFLFDRKVLRYFRKDGHNWRKKKDGKTVKEAHERLKSGGIDVLHCYYAHGEENESFQRRTYWMLEEELSHIVLVHYREVKGNQTNFNRMRISENATGQPQQIEGNIVCSDMDSSTSSDLRSDAYQVPVHMTDTVSMNSAQASEYEDDESANSNQASSRSGSFLNVQPARENTDAESCDHHNPVPFSGNYQGKVPTVFRRDLVSLPQSGKDGDLNGASVQYQSQKNLNLPSWEDFLGNSIDGIESASLQSSFSLQTDTIETVSQQDEQLRHFSPGNFDRRQDCGTHLPIQKEFQNFEGISPPEAKWVMGQKLHPDPTYDFISVNEQELLNGDLSSCGLSLSQILGSNHLVQDDVHSNIEHDMMLEGTSTYSSSVKQLLDSSLSEEGLKKLDSFNKWMSKEFGDVSELNVQPSSGAYWYSVENESSIDYPKISQQVHLDAYVLGPSLSQDQLFSIIDFSPNWVYVGLDVKVLITGRFLKSQEEVESCKWSCMFGEIEVPAEVLGDGVLRCHAPLNKAGVVPFYISCSDRVACSEVREFEYRPTHLQDNNLSVRFGKLLAQSSASIAINITKSTDEICRLSDKISSFLKVDTDKMDEMLDFTPEGRVFQEKELLEKKFKERLHAWLLQKATEGGKGPSVLDEGGQGVLHLAAALGYDWALEPTIIAGVSVNFRDVNGWTALHWAASCGRLRTVANLILLGAAPGAVTDPSPMYPDGRTPADLASANGHKGIAGYLAESALSAQLSSLDLEKQDSNVPESSGAKSVHIPAEHGLSYELSLKDSLAAVCNATQAAARIHQVFRVESFQKKQLKDLADDKIGMSNEDVLSLIAVKANRQGQHDEPVHSAAVRIQNKFRSWKGRKDYLIIRQRIVKIQAHVRGHQVRKNYRKIVWSVGIVEKVILRWRRKRSGLRGFKSEALIGSCTKEDESSKEDDYDFFKQGRKQTEARSQVALARVKSMHQNAEARDQYRRLLNAVTEIQETKVVSDRINDCISGMEFNDLIDIGGILDDDTFMDATS